MKAFFLDVARGFDRVAVAAWRLLVRWWSSPWPFAFFSVALFALAVFGAKYLWSDFVLACLWLFVGFKKAVDGPSFVILTNRQSSARGTFRTHLVVIMAMATAGAFAPHLPGKIAFLGAAALMLLGVDKDVRA